jgi:2-oxoglutarate ferredoxin oxidoreductase subunit gamma
MMRQEVRLAGLGGQGLVLGGIILGEAASIYDGKEAVQTEFYAPMARGAPCRSDIIISDSFIDYPKIDKPNILIAMAQDAYDRYYPEVQPGTLVIIDLSNIAESAPDIKYKVPFTEVAQVETGKAITASTVALGFLAALTGIVSEAALLRAIKSRAPQGTQELNLKAAQAGIALVKQFK